MKLKLNFRTVHWMVKCWVYFPGNGNWLNSQFYRLYTVNFGKISLLWCLQFTHISTKIPDGTVTFSSKIDLNAAANGTLFKNYRLICLFLGLGYNHAGHGKYCSAIILMSYYLPFIFDFKLPKTTWNKMLIVQNFTLVA